MYEMALKEKEKKNRKKTEAWREKEKIKRKKSVNYKNNRFSSSSLIKNESKSIRNLHKTSQTQEFKLYKFALNIASSFLSHKH